MTLISYISGLTFFFTPQTFPELDCKQRALTGLILFIAFILVSLSQKYKTILYIDILFKSPFHLLNVKKNIISLHLHELNNTRI